jgi:hypothetical protein
MDVTETFAGQVIIEKKFRTAEGAENWMRRVKDTYEPVADSVETHLWTIREQK